MSIITCEDLWMDYHGQPVISGLDFFLAEGDYLCILGENGSGKTTLMKGILGLLKPARGRVVFDGFTADEIGYLPQQTLIQRDFPANVREIVLSGNLSHKGRLPFYNKRDRQRAEENMIYLGLTDLRRHSYRALSGGQQQRVLLARALCAASKVLVLDEPVTGLDPVMTAHLYELFYQLNKTRGMTIIMVSHDVANAVKYGSKILHLGKDDTFFGTVKEYQGTDTYQHISGGARNG